MSTALGVAVVDSALNGEFATPIECSGRDEVFVSRIRQDRSVENGLNLWIVSDNLRKGAGLNAVQIAEILAKENRTAHSGVNLGEQALRAEPAHF